MDSKTKYAVKGEAIDPARWTKIIDQAMKLAERGDKEARDWLGRYVLTDRQGAGGGDYRSRLAGPRVGVKLLSCLSATWHS